MGECVSGDGSVKSSEEAGEGETFTRKSFAGRSCEG